MTLWNFIREKLLEHPEQIMCEGDASITYEELCVFAEMYAKKLTAPYYGILCRSEMATAMALLSCIAAGKTAIPFPMRYGKEYYQKIWDQANPPCIITDICGTLSHFPMPVSENTWISKKEPSVILFTSGSTGAPKGVMLSGGNLIANVKDIASYFPINKDDTILIARPLYHSSVLTGEFLLALCNGAKIVFSSEAFQPAHILKMLKDYHITVLGSTPTLLSVLSRFIRNRNEHFVRLLSISGECMTEGMAKTIRRAFPSAEIYCGYGLSEASPRVAYLPSKMFDAFPTAAGIPLPSVSLQIVEENEKPVQPGKTGELLVKGPNIMIGYFNNHKQSRTVLHNGWLHTGDLACLDSNGLLYIKGRKDDMIIRAGMNVYPAEIENILSTDERVTDVLVYGYHKGDTQEIGMKISGNFPDLPSIVELCRNKLPSFQIPSKIEWIDHAEVFSGGKKKRKFS